MPHPTGLAQAGPGSSLNSRDLAVAGAVFAVVLALQAPFLRHFPVLMDEGLVLQMAEDIRAGKLPYRDSTTWAFPAVFYLVAAAFGALGPSVLVARALAALVFAGVAATAYLISRWSFGRRGALLVALLFVAYRVWAFPHWHMLSYSSFAMAGIVAACWLAGEAIGRGGNGLLLVAGGVCGVAVFSKQDSGLASLGCLGLALLAIRRTHPPLARAPFAFALGALLVGSVGCVLFAWQGFLAAMFREGVLAPIYVTATLTDYTGRPPLWPPFAQDATLRGNVFSYFPALLFEVHGAAILRSAFYRNTALIDAVLKAVYHFPWLIVVAGAPLTARRLLRAREDPGARRETMVLALAAAAALAFNKPQDWVHLLVLYPPTILYAATLSSRLRTLRGLGPGAALAIAAFAGGSAVLSVQWRSMHSAPIHSPRGTFYARPEQAASLQDALTALAAAEPGAPLASLPYHPMLNFLSGRTGASRHYVLWLLDLNQRRDEEIIEALERNPRAIVVYSPTRFPYFPRFPELAPKLYSYLVDAFDVERVAGGDLGGFTFLLLRRAPPPAGKSLTETALREGRVVRRAKDGTVTSAAGHTARGELLASRPWPFVRALVPAVEPEGEVELSVPVRAEAGERFEASYGVHPDCWPDPFTPRVRFAVAVRSGDTVREVAGEELDPPRRAADRPWRDVSIDLTPWSGQAIEIVLTVRASGGTPHAELAGWGEPRLVKSP